MSAPSDSQSSNSSSSNNSSGIDTPVLLITFKRLEETKQSFAQIRKVKPAKLYISGDGPRADKAGEAEKVKETRDYLLNNVDWDCKVKTLFRDNNLGCKNGNSSAIEWFFEHEKEGIIIEDDVVVSEEFFIFAAELLEKYRDNPQIMCITADNFQNGKCYNDDSYYFSQIPHCWGWASWRSAWAKYKEVEKHIPELLHNIQNNKIPQFTHSEVANYMWAHNFIQTYTNSVDSWAYLWTLANLYFNGLTCTPRVNLAKHIGYGEDSTHIKQPVEFSLINIEKINFPLTHPESIECLQQADNFAYKRVFFVDRFASIIETEKYKSINNITQNHKPIFEKNPSPVKTAHNPQDAYLESRNLFQKYLKSPRYQETTIKFLDYSFILPDAQSFIWQFQDIFEFENYKFQPLTRNPVIIDCGANVGTSCLYFSKTYPNSHIFAFEPDPKIYEYLKRNIKNNNINNITLYNTAVWTKECELNFASEGADSGTLLLNTNNMIKVKAISLNDFLAKFEFIDFLKIDIEGVEDIILEDCKDKLHKIDNFFIEYHSFYEKKQNYDEILKTLTDHGFRYYTNTTNKRIQPFFNNTRYGTMDLQINIYAKNERSVAEYQPSAEQQSLQNNHDISQQENTNEKQESGIFQNNGNLKILFISTKDSGGAGAAARRMHEAVLSTGVDSVMLVLDKQTKTDKVAEVEVPIKNLDRSKPNAQLFYAFDLIQKQLNNYPNKSNPEMFTTTESIVDYNNLKPYIQEADIINLNWIDGFFDYNNAPDVFKGKKIIWTLHDMHQFTGGCHYSFGCENYINKCEACPQLEKNNKPTPLTQQSYNVKAEAYKSLDINIVTPSNWLGSCAHKSSLMKNFPVNVIHYTYNTSKFRPIDKTTARNKFNIPQDQKIIVYGSEYLLSPVKNLQALIQALILLCKNDPSLKDTFTLVLFGSGNIDATQLPFNIIQLGKITSVDDMSYVYSCGDFLVLPSIMDNFPNIMCEAFACGIPVVGFEIGGLPDLIETGKTGYLAKPYDIEELGKGILWGLNTATGNNEISKQCLDTLKSKLVKEVILNQMFDLYQKLCPDSTLPPCNSNINISSNDEFRKKYIYDINHTHSNNLNSFINSKTDELSKWLTEKILPYSNLTDQEIELKNNCLNIITNKDITNPEYFKTLLLAMVLIPAEELGKSISIDNINLPINKVFLIYLFNYRDLPSKNISINQKLENCIYYLEQSLAAYHNNKYDKKMLLTNSLFLFNKILFYCADGGLKKLMHLYSELIFDFLAINNAKLDYTFPPRKDNQKIKLGVFLSAFSEHTETYATIPAFRYLDRNKFEIYAYVLHDIDSKQQKQYLDSFDHFNVLSTTNLPNSINEIRSHELDILLIGTNITAGSSHSAFYATHRIARIQAVHFCNPCTTGIKNVDYFITGNNFNLDQNDFTEKLILNNNSGICFEGETIVKPAELSLTRKDLGIPENATLFITGANFYKFTWELRDFFANLLQQIPNSYLVTLPFGPAWTNKYPVREFIESIKSQFGEHGIDTERLVILKPLPTREDVRNVVGMCDIYLDSFPYSGATSLLDPFYTNIPMICMKTNTIRGGQGSGMLEDVGLNELIVSTKDEYITLAKKMVDNTNYRKEISDRIKTIMNNNPSFLDTKKYGKDMERIYLEMFNNSINSQNNSATDNTIIPTNTTGQSNIKPNDLCSCGSGLKYKKCCGKKI